MLLERFGRRDDTSGGGSGGGRSLTVCRAGVGDEVDATLLACSFLMPGLQAPSAWTVPLGSAGGGTDTREERRRRLSEGATAIDGDIEVELEGVDFKPKDFRRSVELGIDGAGRCTGERGALGSSIGSEGGSIVGVGVLDGGSGG